MSEKTTPNPNTSALEIHNLTVSYQNKPALWDVDFELERGKIIGIMGPNGSGKTTLLKSIMGLIRPSSGYVRVLGAPLNKVLQRVSYVPQRSGVDWSFPATVRDVVEMGLYTPKNIVGWWNRKKYQKKTSIYLDKLGILPLANRQISQLSGGQQQRCFIARSLAQNAELYLMDEPFVGVDSATEHIIIELLREMRSEGKTVIIVHHDLQTASEYFDYVALLNNRLIACDQTSKVLTPPNLKAAYGGRPDILSRIQNLITTEHFAPREVGLEEREPDDTAHKKQTP